MSFNSNGAAREAPASEGDAPMHACSAVTPFRGLINVISIPQDEHSPKHQPCGFAKLRSDASLLTVRVQLLSSALWCHSLSRALGFVG